MFPSAFESLSKRKCFSIDYTSNVGNEDRIKSGPDVRGSSKRRAQRTARRAIRIESAHKLYGRQFCSA